MKVVLQSNFFGPNGVMYRKGHDGAAVDIPRSLAGKLPKTARILQAGERVEPKANLPVDSRPKPGSGDPNLSDVDDTAERVKAEEHPNQELFDADPERAAAEAEKKILEAVENSGKNGKSKK